MGARKFVIKGGVSVGTDVVKEGNSERKLISEEI